MSCNYYTLDDGGEFKIEVRVENEEGIIETDEVSVQVPPDSKIYVDENIGDYDVIY